MSYRDPETTYRCTGECSRLLDEDGQRPLTVNDEPVCPERCEMCEFCGEWLDDEQAKLYGPLVRVPLPESDHRYSAGHAHCVGQWILGLMAGIPHLFDVDDFTKDEIAEFYVVAQMRILGVASIEMQNLLYVSRVAQEGAHA